MYIMYNIYIPGKGTFETRLICGQGTSKAAPTTFSARSCYRTEQGNLKPVQCSLSISSLSSFLPES